MHRNPLDQVRCRHGDVPCRGSERNHTTGWEVEKPNFHEISPHTSARLDSGGDRADDEPTNFLHDRHRHCGRTTTRKWRKPGRLTTTRRSPVRRQSWGRHGETHQERETKLLGPDSEAIYLYLPVGSAIWHRERNSSAQWTIRQYTANDDTIDSNNRPTRLNGLRDIRTRLGIYFVLCRKFVRGGPGFESDMKIRRSGKLKRQDKQNVVQKM